ncbi:MAG: ferric hydroxamate transport system ATP-binding protein [Propionibacteriaceae bacterium]|nr:ferric hydroxamate transport system ATP-binding protein [Propionibacteriaceae bacterium]
MSLTYSTAASGLRASSVSVGYGNGDVVRNVSVVLPPAKVTVLVGPNGSGKSTLLRGLARLLKISAGAVIFGEDVDLLRLSRRDLARRLTVLAQSRPTPQGLTVQDAVELGRHPHRGRWRHNDAGGAAAVKRAMALTGLTPLATHTVDSLSGGQIQRVWLASCLAQDTAVLLLDEPTNHLDLRYQVELLDVVRDLADQHGVTVGLVLHDLGQAAAVADQVVLLNDGEVVAAGTPAEVLTSDLLSAVYEIAIEVQIEPATGELHVRPRGRHNARNLLAR